MNALTPTHHRAGFNKLFLLALCLGFSLSKAATAFPALPQPAALAANPIQKSQIEQSMRAQTGRFLENKGQLADANGKPVAFVLFKTEGPGLDLYITESGLTYVFKKTTTKNLSAAAQPRMGMEQMQEESTVSWERVDMVLEGATIRKENTVKENASTESMNYYLGHCPDGIRDVKKYEKITIKDIYPGIDWVLYNADGKGFKYDFIVHPGADPKQIRLVYRSKEKPQLNEQGAIVLKNGLIDLMEQAPLSLQEGKEVESKFRLTKNRPLKGEGYESVFGFVVDDYDPQQVLTIDPQLVWATAFGGRDIEGITGITVDPSGNVVVVGQTSSVDFPTQNAGGFFQGINAGMEDVFIAKFTNAGALLWSTYYGGSNREINPAVRTDQAGTVFVCGTTYSSDFPVQNAGTFFQGSILNVDAFILKFDVNGNRLWATYYGGESPDRAYDLTIDSNGNVFVTGATQSSGFPVQNAGTFFQGTFHGILDLFVLKFSNAGNRLWATYYGGMNSDNLPSIAVDATDNIVLTGYTESPDFPVQNSGTFFQGTLNGLRNALILKFDNAGNRLFSSYYGGNNVDMGRCVAVDANNRIYIAGGTGSSNFPVQNAGGFFQGTLYGIHSNAFILRFDNTLNRQWATHYVGEWSDASSLATDACGNVFVSTSYLAAVIGLSVFDCDGGYYSTLASALSLARFDAATNLQWASYVGDNSTGRSVLAVDANNSLFFAGGCGPTSTFPYTDPGGGVYFDSTSDISPSGFLMKFSPAVRVFMYPSPVCLTSTINPTPAGSTGGSFNCALTGTFTSTAGLGLNAVTGEIDLSTTVPGTYTVTYAVAATPCMPAAIGSTSIEILPGTSAVTGFSYTSPVCINGTNPTPSLTTGFSAGGTYTAGTGLSIDAATGEINLANSTAGNYVVTYSVAATGSCVAAGTGTTAIRIAPLPLIAVTSYSMCAGSTVVLNTSVNQATGTTYSWTPGGSTASSLTVAPASSAMYTVTATNSGCSNSMVSTVTVINPVPPVVGFSYTSPMCLNAGNQLPTLAAGFTSGGTYTAAGIGINSANGEINPATVGPGTYIATYSVSAVGCNPAATGTAAIVITNTIAPVTGFSYASPVCITDANPSAITVGGFTTGGAFSSSAGLSLNAASGEINLGASSPGTYTVSYTVPASGCAVTGTGTAAITIQPPLSLLLSSNVTIPPGGSVTLNAASTATSYVWSPASGLSCSNCPAPVASPSVNMMYCVIVSDGLCSNKACVMVEIVCPGHEGLSAPNAFTPNGDGVNDAFCLQGWESCLNQFSVRIYNQWGELVFESTDASFCWDGTYKGRSLDPAVFVYHITASFSNGEVTKKGNISLLH